MCAPHSFFASSTSVLHDNANLRDEYRGVKCGALRVLDATGWHRHYSLRLEERATAEQKRKGWEMAVRIEKSSA